MRIFIVAAIAVLLSACSLGNDLPAAKTKVSEIHAMMDAGKFSEIYAASSDDMKKAATEQQLVDLLGQVEAAVGRFKSAPEPGFNATYNNGVSMLTLDYDSVYERGTATEKFTFTMVNGKPLLSGYDVKTKMTTPPPAPTGENAEAPAEGEGDTTEK